MINKYLYDISITIIGVITFIYIITTIGLLLHIPVNVFYLFIPSAAGIFYLKKCSKTVPEFLLKLLALTLIITIAYFPAVWLWDISFDGRSYHTATILLLKNGWLPLYENYKLFAENCNIYPANAFWANCYVHSFEVISANIYKLTNSIESVKLINFVMLSCLYMYSCAVLRELNFKNKLIPFIISAIIILNPVCIYQWFTTYIDMHLYIIFTILILTIIKIEINEKASKIDLFVFVGSSLIAAMSKFTGLMYIFILFAVYFVYLLILKRDIKKYIKTAFLTIALIAVTGITPFYTNYRDFGHIFYPVFGENTYDYTYGNYPPGFKTKSSIKKFIISTFSEPVNAIEDVESHNIKPKFKCPFSPAIYKKPLYTFDSPDMRICGFGYLWSEILVLCTFYLFLIRFRTKKEKQIFYLIQCLIFLTTFANPQAWWARYVPQLWLYPVTVMIFGAIQDKYANKYTITIKSCILTLTAMLVLINSVMIEKDNLYVSIDVNNKIQLTFKNMKKDNINNSNILLMRIPPYKEMSLADETIIPHLKEMFGENKIIITPYDESKVLSEEYLPVQYINIIEKRCYFYKISDEK